MFKSSRYTPEIYGWSEDLEKSIEHYDNDYCYRDSEGKHYYKELLYASDTYCEISRLSNGERTSNILQGVLCVVTCIIFLTIIVLIGWLIVFIDGNSGGILLFIIALPSIIIPFYIYTKYLLVRSLMLPADIPIRFNRQTGKVYVYDPQLNKNYILYPWKVLMGMKTPEIKVFDWQNLSAFSRRKGLVKELWLAACKPGTFEIVDYFLVSDGPSAYYGEWRWIVKYMEFTEKLSYQSEIQPTHWAHSLNHRFAPPVIWPEGVDKASKAKNKQELAQIEKQYDLAGKMYPEYIIEKSKQDKKDV